MPQAQPSSTAYLFGAMRPARGVGGPLCPMPTPTERLLEVLPQFPPSALPVHVLYHTPGNCRRACGW
jgi:hypothetical protein